MNQKMLGLVLLLFASASSAFAAEPVSIGGSLIAQDAHGGYVYAAQRDSIVILDARDNKHIQPVGRFLENGARIEKMILMWPVVFYVYHTDGSYYSGLGMIDVTSPAAPRKLNLIKTNFAKKFDIATTGSMLLVRSRFVHGFDISNPLKPGPLVYMGDVDLEAVQKVQPVKPNNLAIPSEALYCGRVHSVKVIGNIACVLDDEPGLKAIDVSNPAKPRYLGPAKDAQKIRAQMAIRKKAGKAGIAYRNYRIREIEFDEDTDTHHLVVQEAAGNRRKTVARVRDFGYGGGCENLDDFWVSDNRLYVFGDDRSTGGHNNFLEIYDLKNPAKPDLIAELKDFDRTPEQAVVNGTNVFIAEGEDGLTIRTIDVPKKKRANTN